MESDIASKQLYINAFDINKGLSHNLESFDNKSEYIFNLKQPYNNLVVSSHYLYVLKDEFEQHVDRIDMSMNGEKQALSFSY